MFFLPPTQRFTPHGDSLSHASRRCLTANLFYTASRRRLTAILFFSRFAAAPHGDSFSPTLRQHLTALLFLPPRGGASRRFFFNPPHSGASRRFFFFRLMVAPIGDSFFPAPSQRLVDGPQVIVAGEWRFGTLYGGLATRDGVQSGRAPWHLFLKHDVSPPAK